jgi:predicted dehydrogenase
MVEVARKYNRVVQVGTQNRSAEYCQQAVDYVRSGKLGDVHFIRIMNSKQRESLAPAVNTAPPEGVDYNLWLGPAPERPYSASRFHYNWHWFWDYSGGDIINDGVHQIDLARWVANRTVPKAVSSTGATYVLNDGRDTPDTQTVTWEFEGLTMVLEQALWTPFLKKVPLDKRDSGQMPNWTFDGTRIEVYGTKQFMFFGRMGGGYQIFDADGNSVAQQPGKFAPACTAHVGEFIECVKSRKKPSADIEEGHYSTALAHYGNIAFRVGRRLHLDETKECFVGDDEAQPLLKRGGREGFTVPDSV